MDGVCVIIMLLFHKKNAICNNMDGLKDYHTKWSKPKTDVLYLLYVESKNNKWTYLPNLYRPTDIETKLIVTKGKIPGDLGLTYIHYYI